MPYHRQYLLDAFPNYDYHKPLRPWENNIKAPDGLRNCSWQMQAFHYYWCEQKCLEEGLTALSLGIPHLPHCSLVSQEQGVGQLFCDFSSVHRLVNSQSYPLMVASAALAYLPCVKEGNGCDGAEVAGVIKNWLTIVQPGGVLIAAIMDEKLAMHEGRTLKGKGKMTHSWTPVQFERAILSQLVDAADIVEYDTFHNGCSFNIVLSPKA